MGRRGVEDLADRAEPGIEEVIAHCGEALQRQIGVAIDAIFGQRIMAEQPGPDRALMVGTVPMPRIAGRCSSIGPVWTCTGSAERLSSSA